MHLSILSVFQKALVNLVSLPKMHLSILSILVWIPKTLVNLVSFMHVHVSLPELWAPANQRWQIPSKDKIRGETHSHPESRSSQCLIKTKLIKSSKEKANQRSGMTTNGTQIDPGDQANRIMAQPRDPVKLWCESFFERLPSGIHPCPESYMLQVKLSICKIFILKSGPTEATPGTCGPLPYMEVSHGNRQHSTMQG